MRHAARLAILGLAATLSLASRPARSADEAAGYAVSLEGGTFAIDEGYRTSLHPQLGFRVAPIASNQFGLDFSITAPLVPAMVLFPELDLTYTIPLSSRVLLAPRAGASSLLLAGYGFAGVAVGLNGGMGLVFVGEGRSLRFDVTARNFREFESNEIYPSFSVGYVWGPKNPPDPAVEARAPEASAPIEASASRAIDATTSAARGRSPTSPVLCPEKRGNPSGSFASTGPP